MAGTVVMTPHSYVRAGHLERAWWRVMEGIQSELAIFLPSAQTFINITSQPTEKPTSNLQNIQGNCSCSRVGRSHVGELLQINRKHNLKKAQYNQSPSLHTRINTFPWRPLQRWRPQLTVVYLHGGELNTSQEVKNRVTNGVVLCSCEHSSSSRCPGFAPAAAWMEGDLTLVWTTLAHLWNNNFHWNHCTLTCLQLSKTQNYSINKPIIWITHHLMWFQKLRWTLTGFQSYCWGRTPSCRHISENGIRGNGFKCFEWKLHFGSFYLLAVMFTCYFPLCLGNTCQEQCIKNRGLQ